MTGRPRSNQQSVAQSNGAQGDRGKQLARRQYVRFAFYKIDPAWCRLDADEQSAQKQELADVIRTFNRRMLLRPYSLMGTRADAELLFEG